MAPCQKKADCGIALVQLGDAGPSAGLISNASAHVHAHVRSRGQVEMHSRTPAVAARMPPAAMLVINLRIGAAAGGYDAAQLIVRRRAELMG